MLMSMTLGSTAHITGARERTLVQFDAEDRDWCWSWCEIPCLPDSADRMIGNVEIVTRCDLHRSLVLIGCRKDYDRTHQQTEEKNASVYECPPGDCYHNTLTGILGKTAHPVCG